MLIEKSKFSNTTLKNKTVLITGGGGGIGYEASKALAWLGADVVIAEIDSIKGKKAEETINKELGVNRAFFYQIDISQEEKIDELFHEIMKRYGKLDVLINNATITPFGAIDVVGIEDWDKSYYVNLRAPILFIQKFLPEMKKRNSGIIVFVPSSGAAPFMGAYEVFKTAQVELSNTLVGEIEDTDIITYSIGPGLVKTETAQKGIETVAKLMNISTDEFYKMNENHLLDAETAGTGFAVSVVLAKQYKGLEIGSIQALIDAEILSNKEKKEVNLNESQKIEIKKVLEQIVKTYFEQYEGWRKRNIFERQWVFRDFKKTVGMSVSEMKEALQQLQKMNRPLDVELFYKLKKYYERQYKLLQGYEKNPQKLKENSEIIISWIRDIDFVLEKLK